MANSIKIKRSSVPAKVPLTTDLALGELAINTHDGKLYLKMDDGTPAIVTVNSGGGGSGDVVGPGSSTDNAITRFNGATGKLIQNSTATLDDSGVISVSGANISGLTASASVATDASKNLVSVANTGTGDNVLSTSPTLITPALGTPSALVGTNISGTASGLSIGGNAATVTNGVYTTDTSTVTNTMLAGSIANNKLVNSAITINGTSTSLGGSISVGTVTSVSGTSPISSSGGATPNISIGAAGTTTSGYLSSTDWNTFNNKGDGQVLSVTGTANEISVSSPTGAVTLSLPATINANTTGSAATLTTSRNIAGVSFNGSASINIPITNLSDVAITSPTVNQLLGYNGTHWANTNAVTASAGKGVILYNATPLITAAGTGNAVAILSLPSIPVTTSEQTVSGSASSNTVEFSAFVTEALGRTIIDAGVWDFTTFTGVTLGIANNAQLTRQVYTAIPFVTGTVTTTGTGTTRTATASAGTPFATGVIVASATNTDASYLQTPNGLYQISARTSDTVVTIITPTGYTNESAIAGTVWKKLFGITTPDITYIYPTIGQIDVLTTQPSFAITAATKIGILGFVTSNGTATIYVTYNGTTRNTHVNSPLANLHNDLAGLNGGSSNEYYHSTAAEYTGTGTGVFVRETSPALVTPALGTPTALVGTNISGTAANLTAGHVTTNANLTGMVTSVGNVTTVVTNANLTGGVTSVGNAATVITNANLTGEATSVGNAATLTNSAVIGKVITGYVSGAGTVAATDTILQAIQKLNGNTAAVPGTVTSVSVVTNNGFAGTVATATSTPAITLTTTVTGMLKGNSVSGVVSAGTSGTDYSLGTSALATGILKSTTTTGALTIAAAATDYVAPSAYASANGLTMATARLLGRTTSATGAAEEITVGTGLSLVTGTLSSTATSASLSNDTSSTSQIYPVFANTTTGTIANLYTSNAKLLYKPSTGELAVTAPIASNGLVLNANTVATSYTIAAGFNASSVGPITVNGGVVVTITSGQRWVVL